MAVADDYLTFPNVSSCLVAVVVVADHIIGMHLTRHTEEPELTALAGEAKRMRNGGTPTRCYVIGPVKEWAGGWPLSAKDRTVTRRIAGAMGWPDEKKLAILDQDGWLREQLGVRSFTAWYRAVLDKGDVVFSVGDAPWRGEKAVPSTAFLEEAAHR